MKLWGPGVLLAASMASSAQAHHVGGIPDDVWNPQFWSGLGLALSSAWLLLRHWVKALYLRVLQHASGNIPATPAESLVMPDSSRPEVGSIPDTPSPGFRQNIWGWGILGVFIAFTSLVVLTVKIAVVDYPVELDNRWDARYQWVDENINELLRMSEAFGQRGYAMEVTGDPVLGENVWSFVLTQDGQPVPDAGVSLLVTREATNEEDLHVGTLLFQQGAYRATVPLDRPGVWLFRLNIDVDDLQVVRTHVLEVPDEFGVVPGSRYNSRTRILRVQNNQS